MLVSDTRTQNGYNFLGWMKLMIFNAKCILYCVRVCECDCMVECIFILKEKKTVIVSSTFEIAHLYSTIFSLEKIRERERREKDMLNGKYLLT